MVAALLLLLGQTLAAGLPKMFPMLVIVDILIMSKKKGGKRIIPEF